MNDLTVIYYTAHKEEPLFEERIRKTLLDTIGDLPLISVSQKPIDFGKNICVGEVGYSSQNAWRQCQIGAMEAQTRFVCPAEADFLYSKEYFEFQPDDPYIFYVAMPVYVFFPQSGLFSLKPRGSEGAIITGRDNLINALERMYYGQGMWRETMETHRITPVLFRANRRRFFYLDTPVVTIKTGHNMHSVSRHDPSTNVTELKHWGKSDDFIRAYIQ